VAKSMILIAISIYRTLGRFPVPILKMTPKCSLLYNFRIGH
jgi:hypothetical protein